jgi:hypothetical protein
MEWEFPELLIELVSMVLLLMCETTLLEVCLVKLIVMIALETLLSGTIIRGTPKTPNLSW